MKIKICPLCNTEFELQNSHAVTRKYYYNCSPEGSKGATTEQSRRIREAKKASLVALKGGKCLICGIKRKSRPRS